MRNALSNEEWHDANIVMMVKVLCGLPMQVFINAKT
jgi:hypothetical protein